MTLRQKIAYWICPELRKEIEMLRGANTKVVLENGRLLDRLLADRGPPDGPAR